MRQAALDTSKPLYVRREAFTYGGRAFARGAAFPWQEIGLDERALHRLWDQRRIGHDKPPQAPQADRKPRKG